MNHPLLSNRLSPNNVISGAPDRSIGKILLDSGKINQEGAERIVRLQKERGLRFGEAALKLKLLTKSDVQHALSRQFEYPYLTPGEGEFSKELIAAYEPFCLQVEALRTIRSQLILRKLGSEHKTLAIVSPSQNEGKSYLAANLAVVFAQLGENTLLVDADLRTPRQHTIFNLDNRFGLSSILGGRAGWEAIESIPFFSRLSVLPAGGAPPNPLELLSRADFSQLLQELSDRYDVVILDTPSGEFNADAQTIVAQASNAWAVALMVVHRNHTPLAEARSFLNKIRTANVDVAGTVLNQF